MADLLRLILMVGIFAAGAAGLLFVPMCAIGFANMSGGSPSFWAYAIWFLLSLPVLAVCVGMLWLARKMWRDW